MFLTVNMLLDMDLVKKVTVCNILSATRPVLNQVEKEEIFCVAYTITPKDMILNQVERTKERKTGK